MTIFGNYAITFHKDPPKTQPRKHIVIGFRLKTHLDVYLFPEGDAYIAYSPYLDISGYGLNEDEAKRSFIYVLAEYILAGTSFDQ